jgi:cob(I)alamin adenosyltransferase
MSSESTDKAAEDAGAAKEAVKETVKETEEEKHKRKMQHRKAVMDERIKKADVDRGIIVVNTGPGKGKSSSGFGMVMRALGHGLRAGVIQFVKGRTDSGEQGFLAKCAHLFPGQFELHVMGEGFTWDTQDKSRDIEKAEAAWALARTMLADPDIAVVLLDELNIALRYGYLDLDKVLADLKMRPPMQHVIITGRNAPQGIIDAADTVTEMMVVKHAFKAGVKAQKGIEW